MRPNGPTFWTLNGKLGWRTGLAGNVSAGDRDGLRLTADPRGPLSLDSPDGGLGRLVLPRTMALADDGLLYLLDPKALRISRFDPEVGGFVTLPAVGGPTTDARGFGNPESIAIAGRNLYVADSGHRRVVAFDLETLALRHVWRSGDARTGEGWEPADVFAVRDRAYFLDRLHGRVYEHRPGADRLRLVVDTGAANRWSRVVVDRDGRIYLLDRGNGQQEARLSIYDAHGNELGEATDSGQLRGRFDPAPILLDHAGRFCLPSSLAQACDRQLPDASPTPEAPLALCPHGSCLIFDQTGRPVTVTPGEQPGPATFARDGHWISQPLDSELYRCQWHRIELDIGSLPPGTRIRVSTITAEDALPIDDVATRPPEFWDTRYETVGQEQPPDWVQRPAEQPSEFLVASREGRYLWLRVDLFGNGFATPVVDAIRVHYPRESYLGYLPAIYAADDESRWFLERFLSIFQTTWDDLDERIDTVATLFDPEAVPEPFLTWLAGWLALPLEGDWDTGQKRRLLAAAPDIYPRRGTLDGLRDYVRVYLENITDRTLEQSHYPVIIEGFRERQGLMLSRNGAEGGVPLPLWGPGVVGRLQLDVFAREGEVRLVSTGDPARDLFHEHAHRFRVFVPSSWVRTASDERMVRRALDAEKPAHTTYDLCLVEPRFQIGFQSTIGLDTIIGAWPVTYLACAGGADATTPPSRAPRGLLGYDTILAGAPDTGPRVRLTPGIGVGTETVLT